MIEWLKDPTVLAIPFYVLAMAIESRVIARRTRDGDRALRGIDARDARVSITSGATALVAWIPLNLATYWLSVWLWSHRVVDLGTGVVGWTVAMIGWDFAFYWVHRIEHEVRCFWAGHVTHHSSRYYNLSTALRQSWTPLSGIPIVPLLCLVGVRPELVVVAGGLNLVYQFWIHTETIDRLPAWCEAVFNTPSHHRVHHASNPQYLDKNHGGVLIVWDRLFGTFALEVEPVVYGTTKPVPANDLLTVQLHEWRAILRDVRGARTWAERLGYVLRFPGWSPRVETAVLDRHRAERVVSSVSG